MLTASGIFLAVSLLLAPSAYGAAGELLRAAAAGDSREVNSLMADNPGSVDERDGMGRTPLHLAAQHGQTGVVKLLVEGGASLHAMTPDGLTPFHVAASRGRNDVLALLLSLGEDVGARSRSGSTSLHFAAFHGHRETAGFLIDRGVAIDAMDSSTDGFGATALHFAVQGGHNAVVDLLLEKCADPDARTSRGATPLHLAAVAGNGEIGATLLRRGADPSIPDAEGRLPGDLATLHGHGEIADRFRRNASSADGPREISGSACPRTPKRTGSPSKSSGGSRQASRLERLPDLGTLSFRQLAKELKGTRVVFVGEHHGSRETHVAQLEVIRALRNAGRTVAIGLEMFQASDQVSLDDWIYDRTPETEFVASFGRNWSVDRWPVYRDIFEYARTQDIPMVGLNVERRIVRQVSRSGFSSVDRSELPPIRNVSCDPRKKYRDQLQHLAGGHGGNLEFVRFCEAQMLWDAAMAWNLIRYLEERPDVVVVVMAGTFHSWKHGIPLRLQALSPGAVPFKVVLPVMEGDGSARTLTSEDADYLWRSGT